MASVVRIGDPHSGPNGSGLVAEPAAHTVLICDLPAATAGSMCANPTGLVDRVCSGSPSVLVEDRHLARTGDPTTLGNTLGLNEA